MDTSCKYALMCEKAIEIQDLWNNPEVGDFTYNPPYGSWDSWVGCVGDKDCYLFENTENGSSIWLPRQDQLQDMLDNVSPDKLIIRLVNWMQSEQKFYKSGRIKKLYPTQSMEQLWLAFVMKEKYNKQWNGKDWK